MQTLAGFTTKADIKLHAKACNSAIWATQSQSVVTECSWSASSHRTNWSPRIKTRENTVAADNRCFLPLPAHPRSKLSILFSKQTNKTKHNPRKPNDKIRSRAFQQVRLLLMYLRCHPDISWENQMVYVGTNTLFSKSFINCILNKKKR